MKKVPFILNNLSIHKAPGLSKGLAEIKELAPNINIITGANASGKSSTARVIQQLIWLDKTKGLVVEGSAELNKELWEIKIDSEKTIVQRNGNDDEVKGLPSVEGKHRYLLSLHNLVDDKENDLAKEIAKQSIGGYDLDAARTSLDYSSGTSSKRASEYKEFQEAEKKYRAVREQQKELKKEEESLTILKQDKEEAQRAMKLNEFYKRVKDFLEAKSEYERLSDQMKEFPDSMANLSGNEYKDILDFEDQIEEGQKKIEQAKGEIEHSRRELEKLTIPEDGISNKTITEIEERLEKLSELEKDILKADEQIASRKSKELEILKGFNDSVDLAKWKGLSIDDVSGLDQMLQEAQTVLGRKEFLLAEINSLEKEVAQNHAREDRNTDKLIQTITILGGWLKEQGSTNSIPAWLMISLLLLGIGTAIITYYFGWPGFLVLALMVGFFFYGFYLANKKSNTLTVRETDFVNSGFDTPSQWNVESVTARIDQLIHDLTSSKEADKIHQRIESCKTNLDKLQTSLERINDTREQWIAKLQTAPEFPKAHSDDFSGLYWFIIQVKKWQEEHLQRTAWTAHKEKRENQYNEQMSKVNDLFSTSNFEVATDVTEVRATFIELKMQENSRKDCEQLIEHKTGQINEQNKLKKKAEEKLVGIYSQLELNENDKDRVRESVNQLSDYKQISKEHYSAEQTFSRNEKLIQEHSLFEEYQDEIKDLTLDQVQQRELSNVASAEKIETIQKSITEIETRILDKKRGDELEGVLAEKEEALEGLKQLYERNLASAAGSLIINQLKKESRNQNRPEVFKRANEILSRITNGRYELLLDNKAEPNFRAFDTVLKLGQELSELSTGTRVQLLLSVRLAYVETSESFVKLPLLADELLANSDDERAQAVIESLVEISKEGRQVFYFTAQTDEVHKWLTYLEKQTDLSHKIIQLDGEFNNRFRESIPKLNSLTIAQQVPPTNGKTHDEYGETIYKQPFNILTQSSSELSLWYLIENVDLLHSCLKKGIKKWGQLESYSENNGQIQNFNGDNLVQLKNHINLLERFQELYRKGRSCQIDRDVLEDSGVITSSFIDRVGDKLNELEGKPRQLIQALRNGEISRFRADNADQLEQYLISKGYIDDQEALETDEIIINLNAFISALALEAKDAEIFINRILKHSYVAD